MKLVFGGRYEEDGSWAGDVEGLEFEFRADGALSVFAGNRMEGYGRDLTEAEVQDLVKFLTT